MLTRFLVAILLLAIAWIAGIVGWRHWQYQRTLDALARNVYWEAAIAGESKLGMQMVAYTTHLRAKKNRRFWGGADIVSVVFARNKNRRGQWVCQFSWTCMPAKDSAPQKIAKWQESLQVARDELDGKFTPPAEFKDAVNYMNPGKSARKYVCEFKHKLVELGQVEPSSRHIFFREPMSTPERLALPAIKDIPECKPPQAKPQQARQKARA